MTGDSRPFASLIGRKLSSVEFVVHDYVQLRFEGPTLNAYNPPRVIVGDAEFAWGTPGYADALLGRVCERLTAGSATSDEITMQFTDGTTLIVSLRAEDTAGEEPAELATDDDLWVWQSTEPGITRFPRDDATE